MSVLNKNHPFRESVTHRGGTVDIEKSDHPSGTSSGAGEFSTNDSQPSLLSSLSPKARLGLFLSLAGIICYGYVSLYDALYPQPTEARPQAVEEVDMGSRSVEDARRSAGIFGRLFCRGMQRSRFCP